MNRTAKTDKVKKNNGRRNASLFMFFTFIILIPSGIMMHVNDAPGLSEQRFHAMAVHNICAVIFAVSGILHIKYNFNIIRKYLSEIWKSPSDY